MSTLLADLPTEETPHHFYDLVSRYPSRPGKGLRAALCLATCAVGGGEVSQAVNAAATIELFHNAFLIYDDIQDESELRRGSPTLSAEHGVGIALNVGNATNLLALSRLNANRRLLGSKLAWRVFEETQLMLRHSLEGQAIELAWIRDNVCELTEGDYLRMCLKKTSWYTTLYPCRIGTLIAGRGVVPVDRFDRYGWFLGAAFQIQDDILNLVGDAAYGKEIAGDLWEGKRTLMLIRLLNTCHGGDLDAVRAHLARSRAERSATDVARIREQMITTGGVEAARVVAQELAAAARHEAELALAGAVDSEDKEFLLGLPAYVTERDW